MKLKKNIRRSQRRKNLMREGRRYSNMGAERLDEEVIFYLDLKEEMQFPQAGKGEGDAFFQTRSYLPRQGHRGFDTVPQDRYNALYPGLGMNQ